MVRHEHQRKECNFSLLYGNLDHLPVLHNHLLLARNESNSFRAISVCVSVSECECGAVNKINVHIHNILRIETHIVCSRGTQFLMYFPPKNVVRENCWDVPTTGRNQIKRSESLENARGELPYKSKIFVIFITASCFMHV